MSRRASWSVVVVDLTNCSPVSCCSGGSIAVSNPAAFMHEASMHFTNPENTYVLSNRALQYFCPSVEGISVSTMVLASSDDRQANKQHCSVPAASFSSSVGCPRLFFFKSNGGKTKAMRMLPSTISQSFRGFTSHQLGSSRRLARWWTQRQSTISQSVTIKPAPAPEQCANVSPSPLLSLFFTPIDDQVLLRNFQVWRKHVDLYQLLYC